MACMVPDADKSSADSGKGQSDEDVFNHEGKLSIFYFTLNMLILFNQLKMYFINLKATFLKCLEIFNSIFSNQYRYF